LGGGIESVCLKKLNYELFVAHWIIPYQNFCLQVEEPSK